MGLHADPLHAFMLGRSCSAHVDFPDDDDFFGDDEFCDSVDDEFDELAASIDGPNVPKVSAAAEPSGERQSGDDADGESDQNVAMPPLKHVGISDADESDSDGPPPLDSGPSSDFELPPINIDDDDDFDDACDEFGWPIATPIAPKRRKSTSTRATAAASTTPASSAGPVFVASSGESAGDNGSGKKKRRRNRRKSKPDVPATPVQTMDNFAAERGITRSVLVKLIRMGWPLMMFNILFVLNRTSQTIPHLDCVEFYAGEAMIAQAFKVAGLNSAAYDICYEPTQHDATGPEGLLNAAHLALQLKERGMSSWGTVPYALY